MTADEYIDTIHELAPYVDIPRLRKAYDFGLKSHGNQLRKDGTAFINHPLEVSILLAQLEMDEDTIIAGILHDVVEDTDVTSEQVKKNFGADVAKLVDGVTKLASVSYGSKQEMQVENLRKMFIAMSSDIRVIMIKLCDRLHNARTLDAMSPEKQIEKAEETLHIYAPIAHRLGIFRIKSELEDISLKYLDPHGYADIIANLKERKEARDARNQRYIDQLKTAMAEADIACEIYGRSKNLYSIYRKMKHQRKNFDEIYDLQAIRIIVEDERKLYAALGVVHSLWNFMPGRFKDFVSTPKQNLYRSLHTTLMGSKEPFEIQIRTREMHEQAEYGIAAHWKYKEGNVNPSEDIDKKINWFRQMMELQTDVQEPGEFMDSLKYDILNTEVYVFTPNGDVIELPEGSTPIDFAYKIHSEVGNNASGAKVNGRIVPLNYKLQNGQVIEILTQKNGPGPSRDWIKIVKSTQAKQKIRQWFKRERRDENIEKGQEILNQEMKRHRMKAKQVLSANFLEPILEQLSLASLEELYNTLGYGGLQSNQVIPRIKNRLSELGLKEEKEPQTAKGSGALVEKDSPREIKKNTTDVVVTGMDDILVRFAKCCTPIPGDSIIGYITRGRGVTVHRDDCNNFDRSGGHQGDTENRFIEVDWVSSGSGSYFASVQVVALNRRGIMTDITAVVTGLDMELISVNARVSSDDLVIINISIEIKDIRELEKLFKKLKSNPDIIEVTRTSN